MDPEDLLAMLGADYTGTREKLVEICEAFNAENKREVSGQKEQCPGRSSCDKLEPEVGTEEWLNLRGN